MRRYISCNPDTLLSNALDLVAPVVMEQMTKRQRRAANHQAATPFRPVCAAAVDMFPHTEHCEVAMLFDR